MGAANTNRRHRHTSVRGLSIVESKSAKGATRCIPAYVSDGSGEMDHRHGEMPHFQLCQGQPLGQYYGRAAHFNTNTTIWGLVCSISPCPAEKPFITCGLRGNC